MKREYMFDNVFLEVSNSCNFVCSYCPLIQQTRKKGTLDSVKALKAIDYIGKNKIAKNIRLFFMGEPFLNRGVFDMVKRAKKVGLETSIFTNGSLLSDKKIVDGIFDSGLDELLISVHTITPESFKSLRKTQLDYDSYLSAIKDFVKKKVERKSKLKIIMDIAIEDKSLLKGIINYSDIGVDINQNEKDIERFIDYLGGKSSTRVSLANGHTVEIFPNVFTRIRQIVPWKTIYEKKRTTRYFKCFKPYDHFVILWNGDVTICCSDYDGKASMGNMFKEDLKEILTGKRMNRLQESFLTNKVSEPICSTCKGQDNPLANFIYENYCRLLSMKNRNRRL